MTRNEFKIEIGKIGYAVESANGYAKKLYILEKMADRLCDKLGLKD